jgi:hypothetical protein
MRIATLLTVSVLCSACGSIEYRDSNAAVDANPLCAGDNSDRPGEPASSRDCERSREASWSPGQDKDDEAIDFSGKDDG